MDKSNVLEKILWSIAFPGFGQLLNKQIIKGILFMALEFIINVKSKLNEAIVLSFQGKVESAVKVADYNWLMFYPCIYMFAIFDAYKNSSKTEVPFSYLPFVFSAYLGTVGVVFSQSFMLNGVLLGPVWFPIICLILGICIGYIIRWFMIRYTRM